MFKEYLSQFRNVITDGNDNNGICFDGVVNPNVFKKQKKKLIFLLKETNGNNNDGTNCVYHEDWDYMKWVQEQANGEVGLYRSAFRNIAMWSKMFSEFVEGKNPRIDEYIDIDGLKIDDEMRKSLEKIGIINLKKVGERKALIGKR